MTTPGTPSQRTILFHWLLRLPQPYTCCLRGSGWWKDPAFALRHATCPSWRSSRALHGGSMRSARILAPALALLAATACSSLSAVHSSKPAPVLRSGPSTAATLGIPPSHLPEPGKCRLWVPGQPPGHQPRARSCAGIERIAPAGSWIVYRPTQYRKVVHVRVVDDRHPGLVVRQLVYDARRGTLIRED